MAAPKRPTHTVTHKSLYLRVDGKLQEMAVGTQLTLDGKTAKGLVKKGFVANLKEAKTADVGGDAEEAAKK